MSLQLLSPCRPWCSLVCYNSTPTIVFAPVFSPLCNAVNPELLPLQVASLLCVLTGWLLILSSYGLGHGHLNWVCLKCILFQHLRCWYCSLCLCIPETRKSACGVVYTVKKPRKVEEEETAVPACKKAKTQAWGLNKLSTEASISSLPSVESSSSQPNFSLTTLLSLQKNYSSSIQGRKTVWMRLLNSIHHIWKVMLGFWPRAGDWLFTLP